MQDFFLNNYRLGSDGNIFLKKIKYYSLRRFAIRILANFFVPIWYKLSNLFDLKKLNEENREVEVIVSLTTFPTRINKIWIVIECMLRQSYSPDKIILWLSKEQFPNKNYLPKRLLKLQARGLEIVLCEGDIRSHKKYYYTLKKYAGSILITVDDDFIYPSTMIQELIDESVLNPKMICCHRALKIKTNGNQILPYNEWEYIYGKMGPAFNIFFTSGGGTLFPPNSMHAEVLNEDVFVKYCLHADDIWLNIMSQIANTKIIKVESKFQLIPILNKNDITLTSINVDQKLNDLQLEEIRKFYENKFGDPLKRLFSQ